MNKPKNFTGTYTIADAEKIVKELNLVSKPEENTPELMLQAKEINNHTEFMQSVKKTKDELDTIIKTLAKSKDENVKGYVKKFGELIKELEEITTPAGKINVSEINREQEEQLKDTKKTDEAFKDDEETTKKLKKEIDADQAILKEVAQKLDNIKKLILQLDPQEAKKEIVGLLIRLEKELTQLKKLLHKHQIKSQYTTGIYNHVVKEITKISREEKTPLTPEEKDIIIALKEMFVAEAKDIIANINKTIITQITRHREKIQLERQKRAAHPEYRNDSAEQIITKIINKLNTDPKINFLKEEAYLKLAILEKFYEDITRLMNTIMANRNIQEDVDQIRKNLSLYDKIQLAGGTTGHVWEDKKSKDFRTEAFNIAQDIINIYTIEQHTLTK